MQFLMLPRGWLAWFALFPMLFPSEAVNALAGVASMEDGPAFASEVDPFVGVDGGGNTIPGPSLPFGMVKPGPDIGANDSNSGWRSKGEINGFSQLHVNGTGGGPKYGNILLQATTGTEQSTGNGSLREEESARAGYYSVCLKRYGIKAEITTAARAAIYRLTFPENSQSNLLIDAGHCLSNNTKEKQTVVDSSVRVLSPTEISGSSSVVGGWNQQTTPYTVFFYAVTDKKAESWGTWMNGEMHKGEKEVAPMQGAKTGAWLSFATRKDERVHVKIGISFVSVEQAKKNAGAEVRGFDFDGTWQRAVSAWQEALKGVAIEASPEVRRMFYTSLYRVMLAPVDRTGENPLWSSAEPYFDDYYAIWDTFRTSSPLLTLIAPKRQADMVRALVDIYRHEGFMPDARSGNSNGKTQGGSNADIVLADGFLKQLPGIDWETAYKAAVTDAEQAPRNPRKEGRAGLDDWRELGYVTMEGADLCGSRQMEYAVNDFAVATLAQGLGKKADAARYFQRARNWVNLWDASFEEGGVTGFIRPRHRDGSWMTPFKATEECSWGGKTFYEGNSWTYSFFAPHDMAMLIEKCGGDEGFTRRLDAFFETPRLFDVGNEPGFLTPYLYVYANRHDKTAERVRRILTGRFRPTRYGIPGNEDSGAMSSLYAFGVLGICPVAGQDVYLIGSPLATRSVLDLGEGGKFVIEAPSASPENQYIVAATLNGKPLERAWLRHSEIVNGGVLVLSMADRPGGWPTGPVPPSPLRSALE